MSKNHKSTPKKQKWSKLFTIAAIAVPVFITLIIGIAVLNKNPSAGSGTAQNHGNATVKNSDLVIQIRDLSEQAKFYPVEIDGTKLEVLAVKAPDGTIRTAFNTCQVCYSSGRGYYVQEGDVLVCQNCGNRFKMDEVEITKGGCNPVPITGENKTVTDTSITISKDYLSQTKSIFANWKA